MELSEMDRSDGESADGEKEPGMECRTGFGNTSESREVDVEVDEMLSVDSGRVEVLEVVSGSRMDGSIVCSGEDCFEDVDFLVNRPDESLGGRLGWVGIQWVTEATEEE